MKKRSIIFYIIVTIPFLIAIGFSTWAIIYEFNIIPNKVESSLQSYFGTEQSKTYTGSELFPDQLVAQDKIPDSKLSYQHSLKGKNNFFEGGPIDKGIYDLKIIVQNDDGVTSTEYTITFTVNPKKLIVNTIEMNYDSNNNKYSEVFSEDNKINTIKFYEENGVSYYLYKGAFQVSAMHNGYYYYGDVSEIKNYDIDSLCTPLNDDIIVGSSYLLNLKITDDNYLVKDYITNEYTLYPQVLFKYKTVYATIGDKSNVLCTIEDAIMNSNSKSDIKLVGIDTNDDSYVETCFSKILSTTSYEINNEKRLWLPYDSSNNEFNRVYENYSTGMYSTLMIPDGIILNFQADSKSKFIIGSVLTQAGSVVRHSVVINHGTINIGSSCTIGAYGYLKGNGLININSGGQIIDVFKIYDWPGADEALALKNGNAFPVKQWSVYNVSCKTRVYKGGTYNSVSYIVVASGLGKLEVEDVYIVGNSDTPNCLFKPSSSADTFDYIEKSAFIPNDNYLVSNQIESISNKVEVNGDYIDASVKVVAKYFLGDYTFQTSTSMAIPLNNYEIALSENSKLTLSAASYIFTSSSCNIHLKSNAKLSVNGDSFLALLNGSSLYLNDYGSELSGTGTFGGKIVSKAAQTVLSIKNYDKFTDDNNPAILKTGAKTFEAQECVSSGNIKVDGQYKTNQSFEDSFLYISEKYGDDYYYVGASEDEYNRYKIIYHTNGGDSLAEDEIPSFDSTYTITNDMLKTAYKKYYYLEDWYIDEACSDGNEFKSIVLSSENSELHVYAKWNLQEYNFNYIVVYQDPNSTDPVYLNTSDVLTNLNGSFTYETLLSGDIDITTTANYDNKTFFGWYLGTNDDNYLINKTFKLTHLDAILNKGHYEEIPLYGVFKDYKEYTLNFIDSKNELDFSPITNIKDGDKVDWYALEYINDSSMNYYCEGWYFNDTFVSNASDYVYFDEKVFSEFADENNVINIYGRFSEKNFELIYNNIHNYYQYDENKIALTDFNNDNNIETIWFLSSKATTDYYRAGTIFTNNSSKATLYGLDYRIVTTSDFNSDKLYTADTKNVFLSYQNLNTFFSSFSFVDMITINNGESTNSSKQYVKNIGFNNCGLVNIIIEGDLTNNFILPDGYLKTNKYNKPGSCGGSTDYYSYYYYGLFNNNVDLESVIIKYNVSLGNYAFSNCNKSFVIVGGENYNQSFYKPFDVANSTNQTTDPYPIANRTINYLRITDEQSNNKIIPFSVFAITCFMFLMFLSLILKKGDKNVS